MTTTELFTRKKKKSKWETSKISFLSYAALYAMLEATALAYTTNYGFISILLTVLSIAYDQLFTEIWFWSMVLFLIFYAGFRLKVVKRIEYAFEETTKGIPLSNTATNIFSKRERVIIGYLLVIFVFFVVFIKLSRW